MFKMKEVQEIYFDGCPRAGSWLFVGGPAGIQYTAKPVTNNEGEYIGLIAALEKALEYKMGHITVKGDSALVVGQLNGIMVCRAKNLLPYYTKAKNLMLKFAECNILWVPRRENLADQVLR